MGVLSVVLVLVSAEDTLEDLKKELDRTKMILSSVTKQTMMSQLNQEEILRSTGDSGIKQTRTGAMGRSYSNSNSKIKNSKFLFILEQFNETHGLNS